VKLQLRRMFVRGEMEEEDCGVCELPLERGSVGALLEGVDDGPRYACEFCIAYLGERNPDEFPTIGEYREALARYPEPMWERYTRDVTHEDWLAAEVPRQR
jgi:hypothetical protein